MSFLLPLQGKPIHCTPQAEQDKHKNISLRIYCNNVELDLHNKKARWRLVGNHEQGILLKMHPKLAEVCTHCHDAMMNIRLLLSCIEAPTSMSEIESRKTQLVIRGGCHISRL
jgi:hypothetical protein